MTGSLIPTCSSLALVFLPLSSTVWLMHAAMMFFGAIVILAIESTNPNLPPPPPPPSSPDGGRGCPSACVRLGRLTTAVLDSVYKAFVHFLWNSPMHEVPIRRRRRAMTR
jgi:hypothetical protein